MNGEIAIINERTEVSFDYRQVRVDGCLVGELTPQQAALLNALVEIFPAILSFDRIAGTIMSEDDERETKTSVSRRVSKEIAIINKVCGFDKSVIGSVRGVGYRIDPSAKVRLIRRNHLETIDPDTFFKREKGFIEPTVWLNDLYAHAFRYTHVHVISGERGIGKSSLAKQFAVNACRDIRHKWKPFKSVLFTTYTDDSLQRTIESLRCVGLKNELVSYEQKLSWLEKMDKPVLLIIDNYDNEDTWRKELTENSEVYREILATGCHILITSRVDLSAGYAVEQTQLDRLPLESLTKLFCNLSENIRLPRDRQKITSFIDQNLRGNTYLVRLAAGLTRTKHLETIIDAFKNATVSMIKEPVNGRDQTKGPVMELFSLLYDMTAVDKDPVKRKLLYNLALLPIEGMDYERFLEMAYGEADQAVLDAREALTESFWVFLKNYCISIHPLVKEMISRRKEGFVSEDVGTYIRNLNKQLFTETYAASLADNLFLAEAAFRTLRNLEVNSRDSAYLEANIVSGYDLLGNKTMIARFGPEAVTALDAVSSDFGEADIREMAIFNNVVGYALLHIGDDEAIIKQAERALDRSAELISQLDQDDYYTLRLFTVNRGNHAAKALVRGDYQKAFDIHKENKNLRIRMRKLEDTPDTRQLIGASYKGMGTACYYLSRQYPDRKEYYLREACQYHGCAVSFYQKAYGKGDHPDLAVAKIRWAGAGRALIETTGIEAESELGRELCEALKESVLALLKMKAVNYGEVRNALGQYTSLIGQFQEAELLDGTLVRDSKLLAEALRTKLTEPRPDIERLIGRLAEMINPLGKTK